MANTTTVDLKATRPDLKATTAGLKATTAGLKATTADLKATTADLKATTAELKATTADLKVGTTAMTQVQAACDIIRAHPERRHTLRTLAGRVGLSPFHFQRTFTQLVGISPRAFAEACRLGQLKDALKKGTRVTPAIYDAGYGSSSRLYERSDIALGMTPATYRKGGLGAEINFTIAESPLGRLLLAATFRGVCRVMIGDDDRELETDLRAEYPHAVIQRSDRILSLQVRALLGYLRGRSPHPDLPLDVRATAFQWQVWRQLRAIPYGETRTYREVAASIGQPTATRAVARACATNPVALLIPCHRVIRTDGSMGGYRWGIARKERLLEQEKAAGLAAATPVPGSRRREK